MTANPVEPDQDPVSETDRGPVSRLESLRARAARFDDLPDAEKVQFSLDELGAVGAALDDMLARHEALRTQVEDPDGLVRITLGNDGRMLELYVDEAISQRLDNLAFEDLVNALLRAGNEGVRKSLQEWVDRGLG